MTRDAFLTDKRAAETAALSSVVPKRAAAKDGHWHVWETFIATFDGVDPYLNGLSKSAKLSFLEVFGHRLRQGFASPSGNTIRSRSVEDYLRTVGEEIALVDDEGENPRMIAPNVIHPRIQDLQRSYTKADPPAAKVKPIPLGLIEHAERTTPTGDPFLLAVLDLIIIGFFFLL